MEPKATAKETGFDPFLPGILCECPLKSHCKEGEKKAKEGKSPIFAVTLFQTKPLLSVTAW